ncbi:hypothetical protein GCWU000324_01411 [Kingella oralis ATCC 51147]|uniref:Uncharacterized protein n=1 Tax=Kingella oralis ATCC 51147 TaxID=629741 RepID=C4GGZ2_9NEIS|nr:hypothetical protein GCWU000324_01411 [Kingella oralis ATCC 51147]
MSGINARPETTVCFYNRFRISNKISACVGITAFLVFRLPLLLYCLLVSQRRFATQTVPKAFVKVSGCLYAAIIHPRGHRQPENACPARML